MRPRDSAPGTNPSIPHQPALDGLRGIAVAGVLLFHGQHLSGGFLGVDAFFVLSGFLITALLLAEHGAGGTIGLGRFWARRARRLLPALSVLILMAAAYAVVLAPTSELTTIRGDALATLAYVANWRQIAVGQDYFALFRAPSVLQHTWSLAIEEQFYLVWPLLVLAVTRSVSPVRAARRITMVSLGLAAASYALAAVLAGRVDPARVYYGTDTRAGAILLGAALAAALAWRGPVRARRLRLALELVALIGVVALAVTWSSVSGTSSSLYRGVFLMCGLSVTAVIAASVHPRRGLLAHALAIRPLVALGLISYGAYLYHWPIYLALDHAGLDGLALLTTRLAVTLLVATASFLLLERPIRTQTVTLPWRFVAPGAAVVLIGATLVATAGATGPPGASAVPVRLRHAVAAARAAGPDAVRLMVIGDSVGWHLGSEFPTTAHGRPLVVANVSLLACVFPAGAAAITYTDVGVTHTNPPDCDTGWQAARTHFRPDVVLLALWAPGAATVEYGPRDEHPCDAATASRTRAALTRLVDDIGPNAVAIMTYPYSIADAAAATTRHQVDCTNRVRRAVAGATGAQLVDLARHVCRTGGTCTTVAGTAPLRPDGVHFSGPGGQAIAQWITDQLFSPT